MMKNEKGVTLIIVVITVIVLTIIAAVSITFSKDTINEVGNKKTMAELSNIQQAIFEQYVLLKSYGSYLLLLLRFKFLFFFGLN